MLIARAYLLTCRKVHTPRYTPKLFGRSGFLIDFCTPSIKLRDLKQNHRLN